MTYRLLDLFCGAGGAAVGYARAGFEVVGVDIVAQPHYPFEFVRADALEFLDGGGVAGFDAVHASPPCQHYSTMRGLPWLRDRVYWDSIPPTLERLERLEVPWIMENVERAPVDGITLCGTMFGLGWSDGTPLYRHRRFASSEFMLAPGHGKHTHVLAPGRDSLARRGPMVAGKRIVRLSSVTIGGKPRIAGAGPLWSYALGIDWMTTAEMAQSIPPAYTQWLGDVLLERLAGRAA